MTVRHLKRQAHLFHDISFRPMYQWTRFVCEMMSIIALHKLSIFFTYHPFRRFGSPPKLPSYRRIFTPARYLFDLPWLGAFPPKSPLWVLWVISLMKWRADGGYVYIEEWVLWKCWWRRLSERLWLCRRIRV